MNILRQCIGGQLIVLRAATPHDERQTEPLQRHPSLYKCPLGWSKSQWEKQKVYKSLILTLESVTT